MCIHEQIQYKTANPPGLIHWALEGVRHPNLDQHRPGVLCSVHQENRASRRIVGENLDTNALFIRFIFSLVLPLPKMVLTSYHALCNRLKVVIIGSGNGRLLKAVPGGSREESSAGWRRKTERRRGFSLLPRRDNEWVRRRGGGQARPGCEDKA